MKRQVSIGRHPRGMTLVEVLVTISVLSFVIMAVLSLYDTSLKNIRTDENRLALLHDANAIMAYFEDDLRLSQELLRNYQTADAQIVAAALKMKKRTAAEAEAERVIVYAFDAQNRLIRSVYSGKQGVSFELSKSVRQLEVSPMAARLVRVSLIVADEVAGQKNSLPASSVFAMQ